MNEPTFDKLSKAAQFYQVSARTIYRWRDSKQIAFKQCPSGQFLYKIKFDQKQLRQQRINLIYVRVGSHKQRDDLDR